MHAGKGRKYVRILKITYEWNQDLANQEVLHHSQIILLTVSDIRQEADISKSFEDLQTYLKNPFMNGQTYGYPILYKGQYVKNNNAFIK